MGEISRRSFLLATTGLVVAPPRIAKDAASDLGFLVLGDWGREGSVDQRKVAAQLGKTAEAIDARFVVSTGDNFYSKGVKSVDDTHWTRSFEDVYNASPLMIPWYVTLGNHDYLGNVNAQVDYSKLSSRWRSPANYYKHTELLADGSRADFFHLDTNTIIAASASSASTPIRQLVWLERELRTSTAAWKIVVGHHPVYAGGKHGNTEALIALLKPLFDRFGVQVYLNGHDHDLEHVIVSRTHYLTSGAGSKPKPAEGIDGTQFVMGDRLGFMIGRVAPSAMDVEFIDDQGASLYRARVPRVS